MLLCGGRCCGCGGCIFLCRFFNLAVDLIQIVLGHIPVLGIGLGLIRQLLEQPVGLCLLVGKHLPPGGQIFLIRLQGGHRLFQFRLAGGQCRLFGLQVLLPCGQVRFGLFQPGALCLYGPEQRRVLLGNPCHHLVTGEQLADVRAAQQERQHIGLAANIHGPQPLAVALIVLLKLGVQNSDLLLGVCNLLLQRRLILPILLLLLLQHGNAVLRRVHLLLRQL